MEPGRTISVCGATGLQGGAVARRLLESGWRVRALTRRPERPAAVALGGLGAEIVKADMDDPATLRRAFEGAHGVYSVQNGIRSGFDREVAQGRNVADAASVSGMRHLVYGSAGPGKRYTGVGSWDSKLPVEEHIQNVGVPFTILRPMAFMELMTHKPFFPPMGTWRIMPRLTGDDLPIPWLSVSDLGSITAMAFDRPDEFVGKEVMLAGDVATLAECRGAYTEVTGRPPRTFPMPIWLFDRFTRKDPTTMWRWLRTGDVPLDTGPTRAILPGALTIREWLAKTLRSEADGKEV
jgi:uncharacterized protein YbjT (DUF2867 family)